MFKGLQIEISTLIATTVSELFRVANHNPESQPVGPKIRNTGFFSMVAIRVANRVATRVSIAISQP